jgi:DNA-binding HxlR family transcriptional regulator
MLAAPLSARVLDALAAGPTAQPQLRAHTRSPAQSTLRSHLSRLEQAGLISRSKQGGFPGTVEYELDVNGRQLRPVAEIVSRWLADSPHGPLALGDEAAHSAVKALAEAWSTTVACALATSPTTLTELARLIPEVSYPSLERRLYTMRAVGQIEGFASNGRGTRYVPTEWLRRGVAPLIAAAAWEQRTRSYENAPVRPDDVLHAVVLALPLLRLPADMAGECRIAVESSNGTRKDLRNLLVEIHGASVEIADENGAGKPVAWVVGSTPAWLAAMVDADPARLELGGDSSLGRGLLGALNESLIRASDGAL